MKITYPPSRLRIDPLAELSERMCYPQRRLCDLKFIASLLVRLRLLLLHKSCFTNWDWLNWMLLNWFKTNFSILYQHCFIYISILTSGSAQNRGRLVWCSLRIHLCKVSFAENENYFFRRKYIILILLFLFFRAHLFIWNWILRAHLIAGENCKKLKSKGKKKGVRIHK